MILISLLLAAFVINLDTTIVNVALPSIQSDLNAGLSSLQWVVDAYNLVFAALLLTTGTQVAAASQRLAAGTPVPNVTPTATLTVSPTQTTAPVGTSIDLSGHLDLSDGADRAQLGHGVVIGVVNLMWGVGAVIGPVAGSRIAHWEGARASYVLLAIVCAATALVFVCVDRAPASPNL